MGARGHADGDMQRARRFGDIVGIDCGSGDVLVRTVVRDGIGDAAGKWGQTPSALAAVRNTIGHRGPKGSDPIASSAPAPTSRVGASPVISWK